MTGSPPHVHLDIVTLAVAVSTTLFSPELAALVGPYVVILFGAALGAAWGASRQTRSSKWATVMYVLGVMGLALIITVPASELIARHWGIESRWTLGPVAALIGGIGRDWPEVGKWILNVVKTWVERLISRS